LQRLESKEAGLKDRLVLGDWKHKGSASVIQQLSDYPAWVLSTAERQGIRRKHQQAGVAEV